MNESLQRSTIRSNNETSNRNVNSNSHNFSNSRIEEVASVKSGLSPPHTSNRLLDQDIKIQLQPPEIKKEPSLKKRSERLQKKSMQISIMQQLPEEKVKKSCEVNVRQEGRHRTALISKESLSSGGGEDLFTRPWITTKTITRLISDHSH